MSTRTKIAIFLLAAIALLVFATVQFYILKPSEIDQKGQLITSAAVVKNGRSKDQKIDEALQSFGNSAKVGDTFEFDKAIPFEWDRVYGSHGYDNSHTIDGLPIPHSLYLMTEGDWAIFAK